MPTPGPLELVIILVIVALVVLVPIALILAIVRRGRGGATDPSAFPGDPALDALRTRLANGDIDEIEFERLRSVLQRR